jgi:nucleoside-diphosphate-sugar epimerase
LVNILGLGFTGARVARRLLARGVRVRAAVRAPERFSGLGHAGLELEELRPDGSSLPKGAVLFHAIPPLPEEQEIQLRSLIIGLRPRRIVYISSTGVYGDAGVVDENTPAHPLDERGRARLRAERWISEGGWESLVLRAAAIYGPGRGIHVAIREGRIPRGAGSGIVSRIHVEDLAAIAEAGLFAQVQGAWPVADDLPCSSAEIAVWCAEAMKLGNAGEFTREFPVAGRKVDGKKIREVLGVRLAYPDWKSGILASLAEEENLSG